MLDVEELNDVGVREGSRSLEELCGFGGGGRWKVGKDTDILRLLNKRIKHRVSHSELLSVAEGERNSAE
jgi:hypothetical protein